MSRTMTAAHWGLYEIEHALEDNVSIHHFGGDPAPSPIGLQMLETARAANRVRRPAVRRSWLEATLGDDGTFKHDLAARRPAQRGLDDFVEVDWATASRLVAHELTRVKNQYGNGAIFGGSYGWASAGRFHHAQSQIHRFLNVIGGYVRHVNSYSLGVAHQLMGALVAPLKELMATHTDWQTLAAHTKLFVTFGGVPEKNAQMAQGGTPEHRVPGALAAMREAGVRFVNISPVRDDIKTGGQVEWWPIRPNTDTALILALAYTLAAEGLHDRGFLDSHCVGYAMFEDYLFGRSDGIAKTPQWAETITGLSASSIAELARAMAGTRTMINMAWSLQRAHHGEQPYWALISLASMLGQIGLPGGGFGICYGAENLMGSRHTRFGGPTFSQGDNPIDSFIPVARIADMLLSPGTEYTYDGETRIYPEIHTILWAGGNPFHHHQDLNRLVEAFRRPDSVIVNEQYWTPLAKMADIVLPATTSLERSDLFFAQRENVVAAMKPAIAPVGEARDDYAIYAAIARELGVETAFTEGRDEAAWLRHIYDEWRMRSAKQGIDLPVFDEFWQRNWMVLDLPETPVVMLQAFRENPTQAPLETPSGKIEIYSERIASYGYADCPGFACWLPPSEYLGAPLAQTFPFHMLSDQPHTKLHSQLDHGAYSLANKIQGREPVVMHPDDAAALGLNDGDVARIFNTRGALLAGVRLSDGIARQVVKLSTGAWFDPDRWMPDSKLEKHGNPNVLTADIPASAFSQGCTAQTCLVQIEKYEAALPAVTAFSLPGGVRTSV